MGSGATTPETRYSLSSANTVVVRRTQRNMGMLTSRNPKKPTREVPEVGSLAEASLREKLKTWRTDTAKAAGMPAYVVFNDATLYDLARLRPIDDDELLAVPGIGPVKVEKYGAAILEIIEAGLDE